MKREKFGILILDGKTSRTLRIRRETVRIVFCLLVFVLLSLNLLLCDYVQIRKKALEMGRLQHQMSVQSLEIQFVSSGIENLERQISKLRNLNEKIRLTAHLESSDPRANDGMAGLHDPPIRGKKTP